MSPNDGPPNRTDSELSGQANGKGEPFPTEVTRRNAYCKTWSPSGKMTSQTGQTLKALLMGSLGDEYLLQSTEMA